MQTNTEKFSPILENNPRSLGYERKIKPIRALHSSKSLNASIESDRGRVMNCASVRRLQQRTQIFPLEEDASIRSRLTHSLEVCQTGRYIAKEIISQAREAGFALTSFEERENRNYEDGFISLVEIACLLHDIGNPPFGHFGEEAIKKWAREHLGDLFGDCDGREQILRDLENFEGNAQGIRLIINLQQLNLTYSQIASSLKYTRGAHELPSKKVIDKKPGFYLSEEESIAKIRQELDIPLGHRFPLSYIMESADDICYCISDLEDALSKGVVHVEDLLSFIHASQSDCYEEVAKMWDQAKDQKHNSPIAFFVSVKLRPKIQSSLVPQVAKIYLAHHEEIFEGRFDYAILDHADFASNPWCQLLHQIKKFIHQEIFSDPEIHAKEIKGYNAIHGLLEIYKPILQIPREILEDEDRFLKQYPLEYRLFHRLPRKYRIAYQNATSSSKLPDLYFRVRLIFDCISGMTDDFALREFRSLRGIS